VPTYEYKCENGHVFEVMQRMADDPIAVCEVCEAPVQRVFHPIAVHFKGSGFYTTDYKNKKSGKAKSADGAGSSDSGSSEGGSDSSGSDKSEKKPEKKPEKKEAAST
jgi:putative FmdB family regulatory protein